MLVGCLPLLDEGGVELRVELQSWNLTEDVLVLDYRKEELLPVTPDRLWSDLPILASPYAFTVAPLTPLSPTPQPLPLCFSAWPTSTTDMAGRWLPGALTGEQRPGTRPNLFDARPAAVYVPHGCRLDRDVLFVEAVRRVRWFHFVGDSNVRRAFLTLCEHVGGEAHHGTRTPPVSKWDLPKLCILDNGTAVITYSHWLTHKPSVLRPHLSFAQQCALYTEDADIIQRQNTMYGWADCSMAAPSIQSMAGPGLTYFAWGSHGVELGAINRTAAFFRDHLLAHAYFKTHPTLLALTPDTDSSLIPPRLAHQFAYRNNERIEAQNALLLSAATHHRADYPTVYSDAEGVEVEGWG